MCAMWARRAKTRAFIVAVGFLVSAGLVAGDCECGYSSPIGNATIPYVFTDLLESDFVHIANISLDTDWQPQSYNVTAVNSRGTYGTDFTITNVVSNPLVNSSAFSGLGKLGGDAGLQMIVQGGVPADGYVSTSEMDSARTDMIWGTYRAAMKLTPIPGTVSAFFWYFNDSQEIDMEFLSEQWNFTNNSYPVNLVLQSKDSVAQGYNAQDTGNYVIANLPFNPTTAFHEYRFDFIPGNVIFLADGQELAHLNTSAVPNSPGHLILTQWSNGNPLWSSGPPAQEAVMTVSYVKAYFNSSLASRQADWASRCQNENAPNAVCPIPEQTVAPDPNTSISNNNSTDPYFFSGQQNKTDNQTVYGKKSDGSTVIVRGSWPASSVVLISALSLLAFILF